MKSIRLILAAFFVLGPLLANAVPIVGEITQSGDFNPIGGTNLGDATGLSFPGSDFLVDGVTGDFAAGIAVGDSGFIQDFQFSPFLSPSPVGPLWSIGGFEFVLQSITIDYQSAFNLILSGVGVLSKAGFDDTAGTWSLNAGTTGSLFNFRAGSAATPTPVPEPATLALLGIGLLSLRLTSRRKKI